MCNQSSCQSPAKRRGAVAVEFAVVAPLLLSIVVGLSELTRVYDVQNSLETAAREGARFAAMDRTDMLQAGQTANAKLIQDVTNFLVASGIPSNAVAVSIHPAGSPGQAFDLDDPANDLQLFEVDVQIPYSAVSYAPVDAVDDYTLSASVTFRNGRAVLSQ